MWITPGRCGLCCSLKRISWLAQTPAVLVSVVAPQARSRCARIHYSCAHARCFYSIGWLWRGAVGQKGRIGRCWRSLERHICATRGRCQPLFRADVGRKPVSREAQASSCKRDRRSGDRCSERGASRVPSFCEPTDAKPRRRRGHSAGLLFEGDPQCTDD